LHQNAYLGYVFVTEISLDYCCYDYKIIENIRLCDNIVLTYNTWRVICHCWTRLVR